ncbi:MAG TPA: hypothetical protein ENI60_04135 [Candidatus Fraserbacteria bacterium]|nr:hypothetical protein [Candidatus Fraserbacteria bacterium]
MFRNDLFYSPSQGRMSFDQVLKEIVTIMEEDPKDRYEIMVGSDSHSLPGEVNFVSAIIVHRVGKGGRYFWCRQRQQRIYTLRQKIYHEATLSFELAQLLMEELRLRTVLDYDLEIHVDVGRVGKTRELIDEVVGMIVGSGFQVKIKPDSCAASSVADKHA